LKVKGGHATNPAYHFPPLNISISCVGRLKALSYPVTIPFEVKHMGIVYQAVQDGIRHRGVRQKFMPVFNWYLAGNDGRA